MLVLTRKIGEAIIIGDNIRIEVVDLKEGQVRLGIKAPDEVNIYREEIKRVK
ncbi:MAG: carbon storage [Geobacteraceae bacterium]|nr:MAG: carbon storage [Geobacteraceae bacterium]